MELLGVGLPELFFIIIIALIVLGPKDMAATGKKIGAWLRKVVMSQEWRTFQDTSREIRNLPNRLMREAGVEELQTRSKEIKQQVQTSLKREEERLNTALSTPKPVTSIENRIAPSIPDTAESDKKDAQTS